LHCFYDNLSILRVGHGPAAPLERAEKHLVYEEGLYPVLHETGDLARSELGRYPLSASHWQHSSVTSRVIFFDSSCAWKSRMFFFTI
jgi:hypothetical protein